MKLFLSLIFLFGYSLTFAQQQAKIWYFGKNAGLIFENQQAKALEDSPLNTTEGSASICDENGNLLFYTDGITVWNKKHQIMPQGTDLAGHPSATQSAVAIPAPQAPYQYFLFTVDREGKEKGFCYSLINTQLHEQTGDVVQKNILLKTPVTEKITAVKHRNNLDTWIVVHGLENNEFLAFLLNSKGVQKNPVVSKIGSVHKDSKGYMKASPDGSNIAVAVENDNFFEILDFDNATGKVSQAIRIDLPEADSHPYGVEFSPDGTLFYGTAGAKGKIYQYNLQNKSADDIKSSCQVIAQVEVGYEWRNWTGALQVAPDGKIYVALFNAKHLGVIQNPNQIGKACNFVEKGVALGKGISQLGLPSFCQSFFRDKNFPLQVFHFSGNAEVGKTFILDHIAFDVGKTQLGQRSFAELEKLVAILKADENLKIVVTGHTDNVGNKSDNLVLSEGRAKAVTDFFAQKGISPQRMTYKGYGSAKPIADNSQATGRQKNRRVEFTLLREP